MPHCLERLAVSCSVRASVCVRVCVCVCMCSCVRVTTVRTFGSRNNDIVGGFSQIVPAARASTGSHLSRPEEVKVNIHMSRRGAPIIGIIFCAGATAMAKNASSTEGHSCMIVPWKLSPLHQQSCTPALRMSRPLEDPSVVHRHAICIQAAM